MTTLKAPKKIDGSLLSRLGTNPALLMTGFRYECKKAGWKASEIEEVCEEAHAGDYEHMLEVVLAHCNL